MFSPANNLECRPVVEDRVVLVYTSDFIHSQNNASTSYDNMDNNISTYILLTMSTYFDQPMNIKNLFDKMGMSESINSEQSLIVGAKTPSSHDHKQQYHYKYDIYYAKKLNISSSPIEMISRDLNEPTVLDVHNINVYLTYNKSSVSSHDITKHIRFTFLINCSLDDLLSKSIKISKCIFFMNQCTSKSTTNLMDQFACDLVDYFVKTNQYTIQRIGLVRSYTYEAYHTHQSHSFLSSTTQHTMDSYVKSFVYKMYQRLDHYHIDRSSIETYPVEAIIPHNKIWSPSSIINCDIITNHLEAQKFIVLVNQLFNG